METEKSGAPEVGVAEAAHDDDSVMASWLTVDEETATELSKLLESFGSAPPPVKVRFIDDPYASAVVFQSSSAYVTINGNEESCGSSFSDSEFSVMASINVGGAWGRLAEGSVGSADVEVEWDGFLMDGCDYGADDVVGCDGEDAMWWVEFLGERYGRKN